MKERIYLDYNATAPMLPEVKELMVSLLGRPLNASSVHGYGQEGRRVVEDARRSVAALVGAPANQVIFNSGATEANNTVLRHFASERVLVSAIEHPSVLEVLPEAERIPVTADGVVDLVKLEKMLAQRPKAALVSVMAVNNETGVIQPIEQISKLAHQYGALFHCDAVQGAGRIPIDMAEQGIDFLSLSAHKICGPQGVGALVFGVCGITPVLLSGGGQEKSARAGTENVAGIAGFGLAAKVVGEKREAEQARLKGLREKLEAGIVNISPEAKIYGSGIERVGNACLLSLEGRPSATLLMNFDLEGIAVSGGSACSSGSVKPRHVLKAMGESDEAASGALRISMGSGTTEGDIDTFIGVWEKIYQRM